MLRFVFDLLLFGFVVEGVGAGYPYAYNIRGRITCDGKPVANAVSFEWNFALSTTSFSARCDLRGGQRHPQS